MSDAERSNHRNTDRVEEEPVQAITIPTGSGKPAAPEALDTLAALGASLEDASDDDQQDEDG